MDHRNNCFSIHKIMLEAEREAFFELRRDFNIKIIVKCGTLTTAVS